MANEGQMTREQALAAIQGTLGPASAPTGGAASGTQMKIPVRFGSYSRPVNQGQFDDDIHTTSPKVNERSPATHSYDLSDEGINAAIGAWYQMDDAERAGLSKKMWYLGLVRDPNDFDSAYKVWQQAVTHAANFAGAGREIDPRDVLDIMGDAESGVVKNQGPTTRRTIDLTDPETAKAWVQSAFHESMGRAPEDAEVRALIDALAEREKSRPQVQVDTPTKWDAEGKPIDVTSNVTGGLTSEDKKAFLANEIGADPEATAHQAAGELWPALMAALAGGG